MDGATTAPRHTTDCLTDWANNRRSFARSFVSRLFESNLPPSSQSGRQSVCPFMYCTRTCERVSVAAGCCCDFIILLHILLFCTANWKRRTARFPDIRIEKTRGSIASAQNLKSLSCSCSSWTVEPNHIHSTNRLRF